VPLNEIPKYFNPETRRFIDAVLEQAWQELDAQAPVAAASTRRAMARRKLAGTIVALISIGETDPAKLKRFALNAAKAWDAGAGRKAESR
jgi:hypothetical protein